MQVLDSTGGLARFGQNHLPVEILDVQLADAKCPIFAEQALWLGEIRHRQFRPTASFE